MWWITIIEVENMVKKKTEFFVVTRVHRQDIAQRYKDLGYSDIGKKCARLSDDDMEAVAAKMQDKITDFTFWESLDIAIETVLGWKRD